MNASIRNPRRLGILLFASLLLQACFVPTEVGKQMQADILALQHEVQDLRHAQEQARAVALEQNQQTLAKIEQLSRAAQEMSQNTRLSDADISQQMEHMIRDVQELRGTVEVNEHRLGETETKLEQSLAMRVAAIKQQQAAQESAAAAAAKAQNPSAARKKAPKDKKELLAYALKLLKNKKTDDARSVLNDLLNKYPDESGLSDVALYNLGDSYFTDKKYDAALPAYIKLVDRFPHGTFVEAAYYKIAICSAAAGNLEDAQTFLNELVTNHPKSAWAQKAATKLTEINKRLEARRARDKKGKSS